MISMKAIIARKTPQIVKNMVKGADFVRRADVQIGAAEGGHHSGLSNAELLYIHCHGSPANNIPARNVMAALDEKGTKSQMKGQLRKGVALALMGNLKGARGQYEKAGQIGASAVKAQFGVIPPPNAPATVARKGSDATLIDTGALRDSITYAVKE